MPKVAKKRKRSAKQLVDRAKQVHGRGGVSRS